jgi:glucose/arabinose dehydrogenase
MRKHRALLLVFLILALAGSVQADYPPNTVIGSGTLASTVQLKFITTADPQSIGAPDFGVNSGDPRFMYLGEQNGQIKILDFNQANPLLATNFLDLNTALPSGTIFTGVNTGERGLIGATFSPGFNDPSSPGYRKFYTYCTENINSTPPFTFTHQTEYPGSPTNPTTYDAKDVLREWTVNAPNAQGVMTVNTSIPSRVVLTVGKPGPFHHGGGITFGADGYMYIPLGDGGGGPSNGGNDGGNNSLDQGHTNPGNPDVPGGWTGQGNAQDRRNVYGKILRIQPINNPSDPNTKANSHGAAGDYRIPLTNPYVNNSNGFAEEIYAYGFRNPFRISFDKLNGTDLYAADVGQDRSTQATPGPSREEIDKIVPAGNYGWVIKSGDQLNSTAAPYSSSIGVPLIDPIAEYPTNAEGVGGLAAIGGFIYRGSLIPDLYGKYVFGDLASTSSTTNGRILDTDFSTPSLQVFDINLTGGYAKPTANLHGVAQGADGEIYYLWGDGQVTKLVPEPATMVLAVFGAVAIGWQLRRRII